MESGFSFHSFSSLFIWGAVICLALACSLSNGILTSQLRKHRSVMRGLQLLGFLGEEVGLIVIIRVPGRGGVANSNY